MTVKEILNSLTVHDIERGMLSFDNNPYEREGIKDEYTLIHNEKEYPGRELIMRATNERLKKADNAESYTTVIAKQKLIELGFRKFKDQKIIYKYYIKKVSNQDVEKTTVINNEAENNFFGINIPNRDDTATILIKYLPDNVIDNAIKIIKKQDIRIFIDRDRFKEGDLLLFENNDNGEFSLCVKTSNDLDYLVLKSSLKNNYLLTDTLPKVVYTPNQEEKNSIMKHPLNQILFGPPGTGKTDSTVEKALEILNLKTDDRTENREIFRSLLNKKIFFVTMHPSYSYEDFVQGIKPQIQTKHKEYSKIIIVTHIQDDAANDAVNNYKEDIHKEYVYDSLVSNNKLISKDDLLIIRDRENLIGYAEVSTIESEPFTKKLAKCPNCGKADLRKRKNKNPKYLCVDCRNEFETPKVEEKEVTKYIAKYKSVMTGLQLPKEIIVEDIINYNPQVSIQQIKSSALDKIMNSAQGDGTLLFKIKDGIFLRTSKISQLDNKQKYVLVLDEINRANISKVFGELITLLEEDKRIGKENELSVTLPSGEIFSVPPNLYIIGTMNTADKSIALVDIALRRRFQFIPVYPDSTIITQYCKSADKADKALFMDSLNTKLRAEKGVDFQIGHAYFLKDNSLADVINENVIPLLTEYYRNDLEKVKKLLSDLGKSIDEDHYTQTGLLQYIG